MNLKQIINLLWKIKCTYNVVGLYIVCFIVLILDIYMMCIMMVKAYASSLVFS